MSLLPAFPLPEVPSIPAEHLESTAALDVFKLAAAEFVHSVFPEVTVDKAFEGMESGKTGKQALGDFVVALARFRLKGKPQELAEKLAAEVRAFLFSFRRGREREAAGRARRRRGRPGRRGGAPARVLDCRVLQPPAAATPRQRIYDPCR